MAIQQSKRQQELEKRLQILRRQVYGKSPEILRKTQITRISDNQNTKTPNISGSLNLRSSDSSGLPSHSESFRSDLSYLRQDLLKILIFASMAIGAQIIIFILLQNHILRINIL